MKHTLTLLTTLVLAFAVGIAGAQDVVGEETDGLVVVRSYVENDFDNQYLADDAIVYDSAYGRTYLGEGDFESVYSPFYGDQFGGYNVVVNDYYTTAGDDIVTDFTYESAGLNETVDYRGVYDVENGEIVNASYYYDNTPFTDVGFDSGADETGLYGNGEEMIELIEDNTDAYMGETVTIIGYVEDTLTEDSFTIRDTEPFDFSPATFLVVGATETLFQDLNLNINAGQQVQVTGRLLPAAETDIENEVGYEVGYLGSAGEGSIWWWDDDNFAIAARNVAVIDSAGNLVGPDFDNLESAEMNAEESFGMTDEVLVDTYGYDAVFWTDFENNPENYDNTNIIVDGVVTEILSPNSFRLTRTQPFTLANDLVVFSGEQSFVDMGVDINVGRNVRVMGTFTNYDLGALATNLGYDIDEGLFTDFDENDHALMAMDVAALE